MSDQQVQMLTAAFLVDAVLHCADMVSSNELLLLCFLRKASHMNRAFK